MLAVLAAGSPAAEVRLSNLDQPIHNTTNLGCVFSANSAIMKRLAVAFGTGSDDRGFGYYLDAVSFRTVSGRIDADVAVTLHSADGVNPGTKLATLSGSRQLAHGVSAYTPATSTNAIPLAASSTYFVQIEQSPCLDQVGLPGVWHTLSGTDGGTGGWSLANSRRVQSDGEWMSLESVGQSEGPLMVSIEASVRGIALSATSTSVGESATAAYGVSLASEPTGSVTVAISRRDGGDANLSVSPSALTFSTSTWNVAQAATVSAASDPDACDGTALFDHDASGGGYDNIAATLAASEADDERRRIELSATSVSVAENGGTASFSVRLASEPTASVTISATATAPVAASLSGPLTFAPADWSLWQAATAAGIDDHVDNIGDERVADFILSAAGGDYGAASASATLRVVSRDDDDAGIDAPARVAVPEGGAATFAVRLTSQPTAAVDIAVSLDPGGDPDISPPTASLAFDASNWSIGRTATLRAAEDEDALAGSATVRLAASSADAKYAGLSRTVQAAEADDDLPTPTLVLSPAAVSENGGVSAVSARLGGATSSQPVVLTVSASDLAVRLGAGRRLTIPAGTRSSVGAVTLTAIDNAVDADDARVPVSATATTTDPRGAAQPAPAILTVADDDMRGIELSASGVSVAENGGTATFAVRLSSEPTAAVTVSARAAAPDAMPAAALSVPLTFAPAHWSNWQTATATGIDDDVDNAGDMRATDFTLSAAGGDYRAVSASLRVIAEDDDAAGFAFSPAPASVPHGASSSYSVALATRPHGRVTVAISVAASDPASSIVLGSTTRLVFAEGDWNRPRAVVLRDDRSGGALPWQARVEHRASSADADYDGLAGALRAGGAPTFGDASVPDQRYARGRPIAALVLPAPRFGVGAFSYALSPAPPAGLALDLAARTLSGTPLAAQAAAEYVWSATDEAGATASLAFRIAVAADASGGGGGIDALRFAASVPAQSYLAGRAIAPLTLPMAVGGRAPVRYSLLNVPPGLAFDPATRTLSGTPTEARPARSLVYRATDATGAVATLRFSIAVADNALPSFGGASVPAQTFAVGRAALLSLPAATGGDGALTYALSPALPPGLAFDPATRAISGTPAAAQPATVYALAATDANGDAAELLFSIEVVEPPPGDEDAAPPFLRGWRLALPENAE